MVIFHTETSDYKLNYFYEMHGSEIYARPKVLGMVPPKPPRINICAHFCIISI